MNSIRVKGQGSRSIGVTVFDCVILVCSSYFGDSYSDLT